MKEGNLQEIYMHLKEMEKVNDMKAWMMSYGVKWKNKWTYCGYFWQLLF